MNLNPATIRIKNLRLRTFIGINDDEIVNMQDVVINVKIQYRADQATDSDEMDDALNYKTIAKRIIKLVENNRFSLLENSPLMYLPSRQNTLGSTTPKQKWINPTHYVLQILFPYVCRATKMDNINIILRAL